MGIIVCNLVPIILIIIVILILVIIVHIFITIIISAKNAIKTVAQDAYPHIIAITKHAS